MLESGYNTPDAGADVSQSHAEVPVRPNSGSSKQNLTAGKFESEKLTEKYEEIMKRLKKTSSINLRRKAGYKKLTLTLRPCQLGQDKAAILQRFRDFNYIVEKIEEIEGVDASYILAFPNCQIAKKAFLQAVDLDYKLKKKWPTRPSPKRPLHYISLKELTILEGKALSGKKVGNLPALEIVKVNQVKRGRARLIDVIDGKVTNRGWVSLYTDEGDTVLTQVCEL